ncbi:MAG: DUF2892 domain-containing protein [Desulfobacterales bacterium]
MAAYALSGGGQVGERTDITSGEVNVGDTERILSALGGTAIAIYGMTRGSMGGLAATAIGAILLHRGTTGYCPLYALADVDTADSPEEKVDTCRSC